MTTEAVQIVSYTFCRQTAQEISSRVVLGAPGHIFLRCVWWMVHGVSVCLAFTASELFSLFGDVLVLRVAGGPVGPPGTPVLWDAGMPVVDGTIAAQQCVAAHALS